MCIYSVFIKYLTIAYTKYSKKTVKTFYKCIKNKSQFSTKVISFSRQLWQRLQPQVFLVMSVFTLPC